MLYALLTVIIGFLPLICVVVYIVKKLKFIRYVKNNIRENCTPRRGVIKDILIRSQGGNEYDFYPIIEDKLNNKFYISYGEYNFSFYSNYSVSYPGYYDYDIMLNGKTIKIGDTINIYIAKEMGILKPENAFINIDNKQCIYIGTKNELPKSSITYMKYNELVNEGSERFFDEVKELILYEGFIEQINYD